MAKIICHRSHTRNVTFLSYNCTKGNYVCPSCKYGRSSESFFFLSLLYLISHRILSRILYPYPLRHRYEKRCHAENYSENIFELQGGSKCVCASAPYPHSAVQDGENDPVKDENGIQNVTYVHVWEGLYTQRIHFHEKSLSVYRWFVCFFNLKIWADVKPKTKTIPKAHTYGDIERS